MDRDIRQIRAKVDGYTRVCLTAIAVLLTVLVVGLWAEGVPSADHARAADPKVFGDSAAQREEMTKLQKETVDKLDELITLLKSGEAKVQVIQGGKAAPGVENVAPSPKE